MSAQSASIADLSVLMDDPRVVIVDATVELARPETDGDWRGLTGRVQFEAAHVLGAQFFDLLEDLTQGSSNFHFAQPRPEVLAAAMARIGIGSESTVVVYDNHGRMWATRVWLMLRAIGFDRVLVLDGGVQQWATAGGAVETGLPATLDPVTAFQPAPRASLFVDKAYVEAVVVGDVDAALVCSLGADVFAGEGITRYSRRGHIPGSINIPASLVLNDSGRFLSSEDVARQLDQLLSIPGEIVLYCGGAISASLLAFGLVQAGREDFRVYDGSLEEWSADLALPMVVMT